MAHTGRYRHVQPGGSRARASSCPDFDELLREVKLGRPSAWDRCYRWLAPAVAGYLRMQGGREVEDLTSEVFLAIFRNIESFTGTEANFRSWVFVIAHRRLQDERRRRFRKPPPEPMTEPDVPAEPAGDAEQEAFRAFAADRVKDVCARLAPDQREVLLLRILGDLTVEQVAEVLGKSAGAVKQLQRRGFEAVRRLLEREGVPL